MKERIELLWLTFVFVYTDIGQLKDRFRDELHRTALRYGSLRQANIKFFGSSLF